MKDKEKEKFKEAFIELSKSIIDPEAEPDSEYDLGIKFSGLDILKYEEDQEIDKIFEDAVDRLCEGLTFIDEEDEE